MKLTKGGPWVPARIVFADGLWSVVVDGRECGSDADRWRVPYMESVWLFGHRLDADEYLAACAIGAWAKVNDPLSPAASPERPIDLMSVPITSIM